MMKDIQLKSIFTFYIFYHVLQGINVLVKQRSDLVNKLVQHHNKLLRSNEIDSLTNFSRQIDAIMRCDLRTLLHVAQLRVVG